MPINNPMLARMQKLDNLFRKKEYVSIDEMKEILDVQNRKTVSKTIHYMQEVMGAPVEYDESLKCWHYTERNYKMQALNMSEGELFSLFVAGRVLEQYRNTPFYNKLLKVFIRIIELLPEEIKLNPEELSSAFHFQMENFTSYENDIFDAITKAVTESWELEIEYSALMSGETEKRIIRPYFVFNKHGDWYIFAFCLLRNNYRLFAVQRIKNAALTDEVFLKDDTVDPKKIIGEYFDQPGGKGEYSVEILIKHPASLYISERKWHSSQKIKSHKDGSVTLSFTVNSLKETQRWVLSMGSDAIVLKPKLLKEIIIEEIELMNVDYSI